MAFPHRHVYLRTGGAIGASASAAEKWSVGFRFAIVGADVPYSASNLLQFAISCHTAIATFHAASLAYVGAKVHLVKTTAATVGLDGKYDPLTQETQVYEPTATPGNGVGNLPWSAACVTSLRTSRPRGYASNGRVYYPCLNMGIDPATGRLTASQITSRLGLFKTLVNAMNTHAETYATNMRLAVISSVGAGQVALVNAIRIDDRLDNIERRENSAAPTWQTATIP